MFTHNGSAIRELSRRVDYHDGDVERAVRDLNAEDQERLHATATTILAYLATSASPEAEGSASPAS